MVRFHLKHPTIELGGLSKAARAMVLQSHLDHSVEV